MQEVSVEEARSEVMRLFPKCPESKYLRVSPFLVLVSAFATL